jgi:hypothetical protein
MDTTINNDMFNALLDRVERLANPLNTSTAGVYVPASATATASVPVPAWALPQTIKNKLVAILGSHTFVGDADALYMHFAVDPDNNLTLTDFRSICTALGIEG